MKRFEIIAGKGIRKHYENGYVEVYNASLKDCFSLDEVDEAIIMLNRLPSTALSNTEKSLLTALIDKRSKA